MVLIASSKNIESSTASVSGNGKNIGYIVVSHTNMIIINNDSLMSKFNYFSLFFIEV